MRFIQQRDHYSCGPIAIHNLSVWKGRKLNSRKTLPFLRKYCRTIKGVGTKNKHFEKALRGAFHKSTIIKRINPTLGTINKFLDKGKAVVICYQVQPYIWWHRHFALIISRTPQYYDIVNYEEGKAKSRIHKRTLCKCLNRKIYPVLIWAVSR